MASPAKIREALIRLMNAKSANKGTGREPAFVPGDEFGPPSTGDNLGQARRQARQVQGVDPLTTKFPEEGMIDPQAENIFGESVAAPLERHKFRRDVSKDPSRLPGVVDRNVAQGKAQAGEEDFLFHEFQRLVGRPPRPDEDVRRIIDILNQGRGPTVNSTEVPQF